MLDMVDVGEGSIKSGRGRLPIGDFGGLESKADPAEPKSEPECLKLSGVELEPDVVEPREEVRCLREDEGDETGDVKRDE